MGLDRHNNIIATHQKIVQEVSGELGDVLHGTGIALQLALLLVAHD